MSVGPIREPFEKPFGQWIEGWFENASSLASASMTTCRDQLREHRVPLVADTPVDEPRKQVATFHDSSVSVRINDNKDPRLRKRRVVASLGPQAVRGFWALLRSPEEKTPVELDSGATIILNFGEDPACTKVALTRSSVPDLSHPEHEYVHINTGTLIKAQRDYPYRSSTILHIRPDFYREILSRDLGADQLLSAAVDTTRDMLRQASLLPFTSELPGSDRAMLKDGSFVIEPPVAIDFLEV